jgi:outer membrane protein
MKTKLLAILLGCVAAGLACPATAAEDTPGKSAGDLMVRLRGIGVIPNPSSTISPIGGHVEASDTAVPEADFSYFVTDNIAMELILATTQHDMSAKDTTLGNLNLGTVRLLPPTLTAQYHFMPKSAFSPYLGAGVNYTWFFDDQAPGGTVTSIKYSDGFGAVIQAGLDYRIAGRWYANFDVKHIFLNTTVKINGGAIKADVDLDPTIVGLGIGYRFSL